MFSLVPERLSASQEAPRKQRDEAEREQEDEDDLKASAHLWRAVKDTNNTAAITATLACVDACRAVIDARPDNKADLRVARRRRAAVARQAQPRVREVAYLGRPPASARRDTLLRVAGHDGAAA